MPSRISTTSFFLNKHSPWKYQNIINMTVHQFLSRKGKKELGEVTVRKDIPLVRRSCGCGLCEYECLWVEIIYKVVNHVVSAVYRHPGGNSLHNFQDQILQKIPPEKICLIADDININLSLYQKGDVGDYLTTMAWTFFLPL